MNTYIVIHQSEDSLRIDKLERNELLDKLAENYWGEVNICDHIPNLNSGCLDAGTMVIIEGRVIVPKAKTVVTAYEL